MDLWVVAAAAGAGYIAKNLPNFSVDKKEPSLKYSFNLQPQSKNFLQQLRDKTCPLRRLAQKPVQHDEIDRSDTEASIASVDGDCSKKIGIVEDYNKGWNSSLPEGFFVEESEHKSSENINLSSINGGKTIRNRRYHVHSTRPLSSSASCMDNMEHNCISTFRQVLVTDPTWENNTPSPSLRQFESSKEVKKPEKSSSTSQGGAERMLLFITGMTIGILTATTSWKSEVDELNKQLEQMQSLVKDLHEELERDNEGNLEDTPLSTVEPVSSPSLVKLSGVKANDKKAENLELLSRIEAELQAELEMLELNMKAGVELDPDFNQEVVSGDLKPAMVEESSESTDTTTESDYSKPANYAVSPQDLTLRLHELIESRLEKRIKELEIALSISETRFELHDCIVSKRRFSYSETDSSSTHHSPACICDGHENREDKPSTESEVVDLGTRSINKGDYDSISQPGLAQEVPQIWDSMSEDEGSDDSEMLLIKQILERRKSSSGFNIQIEM